MGTRSITTVYSEDNKPLVCLYRQFDGYPDGHGAELREFLAPRLLGNGIGVGATSGKFANGMGCLAAQLVAHFKGDHLGAFYLVEPDAQLGAWGTEYHYHVRFARYGEPARVTWNPAE